MPFQNASRHPPATRPRYPRCVLPLFSSIDPGTGGLILVGVVLFVAMLRGR